MCPLPNGVHCVVQVKLEEVEKLTAGGSLVLSVGETDAKLKAMLSEALNDADARLAQKDDECAALRDSIDALRRDVKELQGQAVVITAERSAAEVTPAVVHQLSPSFCWRPHWCCCSCTMSRRKSPASRSKRQRSSGGFTKRCRATRSR